MQRSDYSMWAQSPSVVYCCLWGSVVYITASIRTAQLGYTQWVYERFNIQKLISGLHTPATQAGLYRGRPLYVYLLYIWSAGSSVLPRIPVAQGLQGGEEGEEEEGPGQADPGHRGAGPGANTHGHLIYCLLCYLCRIIIYNVVISFRQICIRKSNS